MIERQLISKLDPVPKDSGLPLVLQWDFDSRPLPTGPFDFDESAKTAIFLRSPWHYDPRALGTFS
jgi:hypothetical protein